MAVPSRHAPRRPDLLDIRLRPLSVRTLKGRNATSTPDAIERVRGEFVEMRGFSPTLQQAARLFHLTQEECLRVLNVLLRDGFIQQTSDGRFRLTAG